MSRYNKKNKEKIANIKSLILKANDFLDINRNIKLTTIGKFFSTLENDISGRREYNKKKLSLINKTNICNTTRIQENLKLPKNKQIIYFNNSKNKYNTSLSKDKNIDLSYRNNKLITVNKIENSHKNNNLIELYKNQCKSKRPLSAYSDIKLKKLKIFKNKDKNSKYKLINKYIMKNNQKLIHNRNINSNILISDNIIENNFNNLTQRNTFSKHKNLFLSLKNKFKQKILNTSRNKNLNSSSRMKNLLNKTNDSKNFDNNSKEEEDIYMSYTYNDENSRFNKSNINFHNYNNSKNINKNKKLLTSLIKPTTKKLINKTLPDREKIFDSVQINKFNSNNNFLYKHKQKNSNILYKIPLELRKKIRNKLNNSITLIKNSKNKSIDKNLKKYDNKISKKFTSNNIKKNFINNNKINNQILFNSIEKKDFLNPNLLFSPTSSVTKENTLSIKDIIIKKIMKIDSCTIAGYSSPGIQKINQDNFFIIKEFLGEQEQFFLGVCDGHGTYGHLVSEYITKMMPNYLLDISDESIIKTFISINNSLIRNSKIDCSLSGSTCTALIINLEKIVCANLGDSRAVLCKYENGKYSAVNLSKDHKPNSENEMKRILKNGGRIKPFYDEDLQKFLGPERVWLKNSDIPGLAMTRSFGDNLAHSVGVISEPEILKYEFNGNEKFIILASDGIWEYIDSDECVNIVKDFYENDMDAIGALNSLVKEAFNRWKNMEDSIDDITAIVIFFE